MSQSAIFQFLAVEFDATGKVDRKDGVIRDVAVITSGVTAKGHNLEVDDKTLDQIIACGREKGQVQVKLNHKTGVEFICGYLTNFRRVKNKAIADWHLLKSHEEYEKTMEKAERMPGCFGMSAAFAGPEKGEKLGNGKMAARCTELLAVDCVPMPAANPDGLFEAKVDNEAGFQMSEPKQPAKEPTLADVMAAIGKIKTDINTRLDNIEARQEAIETGDEDDVPLTRDELDQLNQETDAQLAERGITREHIQAAIAALDAPEATHDSPADTAAAAASKAPAESALSALRHRILELETKLGNDKASAEAQSIEHDFAVLEEKITMFAELLEQKDAQITHLQAALRLNGVRAATPATSVERMFNAQEGMEGVHEFDQLVTNLLSTKEAKSRASAIRMAIDKNPRAYALWRQDKGISTLAA